MGNFCSSPAFDFLCALAFERCYITIYLVFHDYMPAAASGFVVCNFCLCASMYAYARSLYLNGIFPGLLAFCCTILACVSGLLLGVPLVYAIQRGFEPWAYFLMAWAVTLAVSFVQTDTSTHADVAKEKMTREVIQRWKLPDCLPL